MVSVERETGRLGPVRVGAVDLLTFRAFSGEANRLSVRFTEEAATVTDSVPISTGNDCRLLDATRLVARCDLEPPTEFEHNYFGDHPAMRAALGDGDDSAAVRGTDKSERGVALSGEAGDDRLAGGFGPGVYSGGSGDDVMMGHGIYDVFDEGSARNGSDTIIAKDYNPTISYERRAGGVQVDLQGDRDDGAPGERDRVVITNRAAVGGATLIGGRGGDRLTGDSLENVLIGGRGRDVLRGGPRFDYLWADREEHVGRIRFGGGDEADWLHGGRGDDIVVGNRGPNVVRGGPGADGIWAGPGDDMLLSRDRSSDELRCGAGRDRAVLDTGDFFRNLPGRRCERSERDGPVSALPRPVGFGVEGSTPLPGQGTEISEDGALLDLGCPGDAQRVCRGRVSVRYRGRVLGSASYGIRRNRTSSERDFLSVEVPFRGRQARKLLTTAVQTAVIVSSFRDRSGRLRRTETRAFVSFPA